MPDRSIQTSPLCVICAMCTYELEQEKHCFSQTSCRQLKKSLSSLANRIMKISKCCLATCLYHPSSRQRTASQAMQGHSLPALQGGRTTPPLLSFLRATICTRLFIGSVVSYNFGRYIDVLLQGCKHKYRCMKTDHVTYIDRLQSQLPKRACTHTCLRSNKLAWSLTDSPPCTDSTAWSPARCRHVNSRIRPGCSV